ncbi:hypothetical protein JOM56_010684 [Amanita muscaria]
MYTLSEIVSLQVDTGSSDFVLGRIVVMLNVKLSLRQIKQKRCICSPSSATQTAVTFYISYLRSSVSGPIVWDHVQVGGYTIDNQALAAATTATGESLFLLLLGLPLNSIIASLIPPVTDNNPDGAAWTPNLANIIYETLCSKH